jgi:hypothetical protein
MRPIIFERDIKSRIGGSESYSRKNTKIKYLRKAQDWLQDININKINESEITQWIKIIQDKISEIERTESKKP